MHNSISLQKEILRKLIHFGSGIIPILVIIFGKGTVLPILVIFTILFILVDFLKSKINWMFKLYKYFFQSISRKSELYKLTGASWFLLGDVIVLIIFPENIAIFSMLLLSVSDTFAAIVGKIFGKTKLFLKSLEGTFAFFLSGLIVSMFFQDLPLSIRLFTVLTATIVEIYSTKINDNLTIPIASAFVCTLGIKII